MRKEFITIIVIAFILQPILVNGQDTCKIKGKITDEAGTPLSEANVFILDTKHGTATDKNGNYNFSIPASETGQQVTLEACFMGFRSQSLVITISSGTITHNFQLTKDVLQLKPVVVSAQKRREDLQKVPISISVSKASDIRRLSADRMVDLDSSIPNLRLSGNKTQVNQTSITIRGIHDFSRNIGYEARAGIYIDGVYAGRSSAVNLDLFDLDRVEILRGPQGTMFGKNTVAGAICLTTRKPHGRLEGMVNVDGGNYNYIKTDATLNIPFIQNKLFAKVSAKKMNRDGFIKNLYDNTYLNGANGWSSRAQLRYLASEALEFNLSIDGTRDRIKATNSVGISGPAHELAPNPRHVNHDGDEFEHRDLFGIALSMNYDLPGDYTFKSISSYRWSKFNRTMEEDYLPVFVAISNSNEENDRFTQEVQLLSPINRKINFVSGLYLFYQKTKSTTSASGGPEFPVLPYAHVATPGEVVTNSVAGYVHGNINLTKKLTLTAGLRYTYEAKKLNYSIINKPFPFLFIELNDYKDDYSKGEFSPKGGINYSINENTLLYGTIAQAYKSGGWNADFIKTVEQIRFKPEFATNYELGLKSTTWNNRLRFNAAAFLTKFRDYQVFQFVRIGGSETIIILTNAGKVTTQGFEAEISALTLPGLTIFGGLGYTDARFDKFKNGGGEGKHYDGHKLPWAPKFKFNIAVDFQKSIRELGKLMFQADYTYIDDYFSNANNDRDEYLIAGYDLINARIGFELLNGSWGLFLWGKNLADKLYMTYKDLSFLRTPRAWYGMPRTYGIQVSYRFLKL